MPEPVTEEPPTTVRALTPSNATCADFDAYQWAQAVFESDPKKYNALDPDGDGEACPELTRKGFAPAFWLDEIPKDVEEAEVVRLVDGDTIEVRIDGVSNRVRIYRADTPETQNEQHCGGAEATAFAEFALSFNDEEDGTVYLERDKNEKDRYGRELAFVWFEVDDKPYMLNHILINNGWAEDVDYGDRKYDEELKDAAAFAKRHGLGVWDQCGAFELPLAAAPAPTSVPRHQRPCPGSKRRSRIRNLNRQCSRTRSRKSRSRTSLSRGYRSRRSRPRQDAIPTTRRVCRFPRRTWTVRTSGSA